MSFTYLGDAIGAGFFQAAMTTAATPNAGTYFFIQSEGGATDAYFEIDLNATSGFGGLLIRDQTDGTGAHDWKLHVHRTPNICNIENNTTTIATWETSGDLTNLGKVYASSFVVKTSPTAPTVPSGAYFYHQQSALANQGNYAATVQTIDATVTTIATITVANLTQATVTATINGLTSTAGAGIGGTLIFTARRSGGGAVLIGSPIVNLNEDAAGAPTFTGTVSGNNMLIRVTGEAATTYNWSVFYEVAIQS